MKRNFKMALIAGVFVLLVWVFWFWLPERFRDFWFGREDSELKHKRELMKRFREVLRQYKDRLSFFDYARLWACGGGIGSPLSPSEFESVAFGDVSPLQKFFKGVRR